jgi:hypothetical protein
MKGQSEYYPPRANWLSPVRAGRLQLDAFLKSAVHPLGFNLVIGLRDTLLSILIPGYSIRYYGFKTIGNLVILTYLLGAAVFLVGLGYAAANYSFSIMLSLHVTSICFALRYFVPDWRLTARLAASLAILFSVSVLIYLPIRHLIEKVARPLRTQQRVIIVTPAASPKALKRGAWVAYTMSGTQTSFNNAEAHGTVILQDGFGLGKIVGVPGDAINFSKTNFFVNGVGFPREPQMPIDGELVVPENHWFIWPDLAMNMRGAAAGIYMEQLLKNRSLVAQTNFVGVPFKHWFFRNQTL